MFEVFPQPRHLNLHDGCFTFDKQVFLRVPASFSNQGFLELCGEWWHHFTAGQSSLCVMRTNRLSHTACITTDANLSFAEADAGEDEYTVCCLSDGIIMGYQEDIGLIHAFFTVLQTLGVYHRSTRDFSVPCYDIADRPSLAFRGVHICVFMGDSYEFLRKAVRMCALMKYTHVFLEFWGSLRLDFLRASGWDGGLTKQQVADLVKEGMALGLEFVPFFNHFGHASQSRFRAGKHVYLDQAPDMEELFEQGGWTWNIHHPETYEIHAQIRKELCELMPGKYFHIGCDEVYARDDRVDPMDKKDNDDFINYINRCCDEVVKLGRRPIVWADMFLNGHHYPWPYCSNVSYRCLDTDRNLDRLHKDAILVDWQYNIAGDKTATVDYLIQHRDPSTMMLAPWHTFDNIDGRCSLAKQHGMMGMIDTTWDLLRKEFTSVIYAACASWEETNAYEKLRTNETIKSYAMQNMRKVMPSGGNFASAGFFDHEIDTILGTTG